MISGFQSTFSFTTDTLKAMGMGAIGLIGGLASTGLQIYGMHQQGKAAKMTADYNNQLAQTEARNLELETSEGIKRERINQRGYLAELRARMGAGGGIQADTGSALSLMGEAAGRLEIGVADAARKANMQSASIQAQGRMGIWEAKQANKANKIAMIGAGIQGLSSAFGQFQTGKHYGNF